MKTLKRLWLRIPRKTRVCVNILAILLLLVAVYIFLGCPAFSPEHHFRRLEKANLVGPAEIIEIVELPNGVYDQMIVADDGDAVILYCYSLPSYRWDWGTFVYREKTAPITVLAMPGRHFGFIGQSADLPVLLLHDEPRAVRAELELTLGKNFGIQETVWESGGNVSRRDFEKTYFLEAESDISGYFRFNIHAETDGSDPLQTVEETVEGRALKLFSRMFVENGMYLEEYVPATVRLYDSDGQLIAEESLTIRSPAGEKYAREEGIS